MRGLSGKSEDYWKWLLIPVAGLLAITWTIILVFRVFAEGWSETGPLLLDLALIVTWVAMIVFAARRQHFVLAWIVIAGGIVLDGVTYAMGWRDDLFVAELGPVVLFVLGLTAVSRAADRLAKRYPFRGS